MAHPTEFRRPFEGAEARPVPMEPHPFRVIRRVDAAPETVTLTLRPVGVALGPPRPGQFVMLYVFGVGEIPISVSGWGEDGSLELTVRAVGATSTVATRAGVGELLGVRGPYGTPWPIGAARGQDVVVMAGGLGLAPLRLAIDALAHGDAAPRSLTVLVGARQPGQLLYLDQLADWSRAGAAVHLTVDAADREWHGSVGTATELLERHQVRADVAFVCGPELMMLSAARALVHRGIVAERVHVSLERNMHCGIAHCGRCQLGPVLLCRDGPVVAFDQVDALMKVRGR